MNNKHNAHKNSNETNYNKHKIIRITRRTNLN